MTWLEESLLDFLLSAMLGDPRTLGVITDLGDFILELEFEQFGLCRASVAVQSGSDTFCPT